MRGRANVHRQPRRVFLLTAAIGLVVTTATVAPSAAASLSCGIYSYSFVGTRLLNDGISDSAGPYSITLPAGTYDVMMRSYDFHSEQGDQIDQEAERWWFSLDSGWHSIATDDLPDDQDRTVTMMAAQDIPASGAITVHHLGHGGINSIEPVCVGFTPVDEDPQDPGRTPDDGDPGDPGDPDDDPDRAIPDDPAGDDDPGPGPDPGDDPDRRIPDDPGDDPDRRIPDEPDSDDPGPGGGDPGRIPDEPDSDDPGPGGDEPGRTPDEPVVPELAITGVNTIRLVGLAIVLLHVGGLCVWADRLRTVQESRRSSSG